MATTYIFGFGPGVFILGLIWALAFLVCLVFSQSSGGHRFIGIGLFIVTLLATIVLLAFPRESKAGTVVTPQVIYDHLFVGRIVLLIFMFIMAIYGLTVYLGNYAGVKILAQPIQKRIGRY